MAIHTELTEKWLDREPLRTPAKPGACAVAAPFPILRPSDHTCSYRVERDVPRKLEAVGLLFDEDAFESFLEEVTFSAMASVEPLNVSAEEAVHAFGKRAFGRLDDEMVMIRHQGVFVNDPAGPDDLLRQQLEKQLPIFVITEYRNTVVPARHCVMQRAGMFGPRLSRHAIRGYLGVPGETEAGANCSYKTSSEWKELTQNEEGLLRDVESRILPLLIDLEGVGGNRPLLAEKPKGT